MSAADIAPYICQWFYGKNGLDIGCGAQKVVPWAIGIEPRRGAYAAEDMVADPPVEPVNLIGDGCELPWFEGDSLDFVFSSHMLEHVPREAALRAVGTEWPRVLKPGGLLVLYLPDGRVFQPDFHAWHPLPGDFAELLAGHRHYVWIPREELARHKVIRSLEYSFLVVTRK